jgi:hypothetical protein
MFRFLIFFSNIKTILAIVKLTFLLLLLVSLVFGINFIPNKTISILLSTVISFIFGMFFMHSLKKSNLKINEMNTLEREEIERELRKEISEVQEEKLKLILEKEYLKNQKVDTHSIENSLKLTLIESEQEIKDFKKETSIIKENSVDYIKDTYEYIGLISIKVKAMYGFDLHKLKLVNNKDVITVFGLNPTFIGYSEMPRKEALFKEIRSQEYGGIMTKNSELKEQGEKLRYRTVLDDSGLLVEQYDTHLKEVQERLQNGIQNLEFLEEPLIKIGKKFIEMILMKLDKKIDFSLTDAPEKALNLVDFVKTHNKNIDSTLNEKNETLRQYS